MLTHPALRMFAVALVLSGTCIRPAAAGPRGTTDYDLALDVVAAPDPTVTGGQVTVTFTALNNGPAPTAPVSIHTSTPDGTTFESATVSAGDATTPSPGGTGAIVAQLPAGLGDGETATLEVVFTVAADPGATLSFAGSVASGGPNGSDTDPGNNDATVDVEVAAANSADVAVEITPFADEAGSGALFSYDVEVTNLSESEDGTAQEVTLSIDIPDGAGFAEVDSDGGDCSTPEPGGGGTVVCSFAEIAPGDTVTAVVTIQVLAEPGQTLDLTASVQTASTDSDDSNDSAEAQVDVVPSPPVMLDWDEPDSAAATEFPPPRNLVVEDEDTRGIARAAAPTHSGARRDTVSGYKVYGSTMPGVRPGAGNLLTTVPASQTSTMVPAAPSGTFFVVTAAYSSGESAPSNEASGEVPAGTIASVKLSGAKVTVAGTSFSATVSVSVDGVPFASPAKVKKAGTKVVQKGNLVTGQSVSAYLAAHPNVLVTVRNSNGGVAAFRYPH